MAKHHERDERQGWRRQQENREGPGQWSPAGREDDYGWQGHRQQDRNWRNDQEVNEEYRGRTMPRGRYEPRGWEDDERMGGSWNPGPERWSPGTWNQSAQGRYAGCGPRSYKRQDDRIEEDINERLTRHSMIDASDIEVHVENGEVTLRGQVDSRQAKRLAEDIAESCFGVEDVINQIKIKHHDREERNETEGSTKRDRKAS